MDGEAMKDVAAALRAIAQAQRTTAAALDSLAAVVEAPPSNEQHASAPDLALLTVPQAAGRIGMSRGFVYRAIEEGRLPVVRMGNRVRVLPETLERFVEKRSTAPAPDLSDGRRGRRT